MIVVAESEATKEPVNSFDCDCCFISLSCVVFVILSGCAFVFTRLSGLILVGSACVSGARVLPLLSYVLIIFVFCFVTPLVVDEYHYESVH